MIKFCVLILCVFLCSPKVYAKELNVFAAASLTDAIEEIGENFQKSTGIKVYFNLAGSNTLRLQIEKGAFADIFICADTFSVDQLVGRNLISKKETMPLLLNRLVVVSAHPQKFISAQIPRSLLRGKSIAGMKPNLDTPMLASGSVEGFISNLNQMREMLRGYLSLSDPNTVPSGRYAKQALETAGIWNAIKDKVIPSVDVRAALLQVEMGNADYGIVYKTDAAISKKVQMIYRVPNDYHMPIVYQAALIKDRENKEEAQRFFDYLKQKQAKDVFVKYGFEVVLP